MKTLSLINEFFAQERFALVGVSRSERDFSRLLFKEFTQRGYDVVPVNPHVDEIESRKCYPSILDVNPRVNSVLLMTSEIMTKHVLEECSESGVTLAWVYGISGRNVDPRTIQYCEDHGIRIVAGYCPFMFLPNAAMFHRLHGWVWNVIGYYPN